MTYGFGKESIHVDKKLAFHQVPLMLAFYCFIIPFLFLKVVVRGVCALAQEGRVYACGCALRRVVDLFIIQQILLSASYMPSSVPGIGNSELPKTQFLPRRMS